VLLIWLLTTVSRGVFFGRRSGRTGIAPLPRLRAANKAACHGHERRPMPGEAVCLTSESDGAKRRTGNRDESTKKGAGSPAVGGYRKRNPLGALVHRAGGSMRDAMSPRGSQPLHTRRRSLPIAICGQDCLVLLMVSITLPSVKRRLGMYCREDYKSYTANMLSLSRGKLGDCPGRCAPMSARSADDALGKPWPGLFYANRALRRET
jgi:hypothetical protein